MKLWIAALALSILSTMLPQDVEAGYSTQFLGVCQKCGKDIIAEYRPVLCTNGCTQWQWVTIAHHHCRPAYKGKRKFDFFHSPLVNPANKRKPKFYRLESRRGCCN